MRQQVNQGFFKLIYAYGVFYIHCIGKPKMNNMLNLRLLHACSSVGCHNYLN